MPRTMNPTDQLWFVLGRLDGLSGTTRYEIPEELRAELRAAAQLLRAALERDAPAT